MIILKLKLTLVDTHIGIIADINCIKNIVHDNSNFLNITYQIIDIINDNIINDVIKLKYSIGRSVAYFAISLNITTFEE